MTGPPLDAFDARPTQTLPRHLSGVVAGVDALTPAGTETPYEDPWPVVMETIAWTHDIGKLTTYFQAYLETGDRSVADPPELTSHGEVSALVTLQALEKRGFSAETVAAGFFAVAKHHSVLGNLQSSLHEYTQNSKRAQQTFDLAGEQLSNIDDNAARAANTVLNRATAGALSWDDVWVDNPQNYAKALSMLVGGVDGEEFYGCVLKAWSTLVAADKSDASNLTSPDNLTEFTAPKRPSVTDLTKEVRTKSDTVLPSGDTAAAYLSDPFRELPGQEATTAQRLAALRTAANARATATITSSEHADTQVFEVTLPTGFGKTYTGLRAALSRANERDSRVIYALPYTSIIDQVDTKINDVFGLESGALEYIKHHHLTDTRTSPSTLRSDHYSTGQDTVHAEAWRSGLVLTTFTQLFESVAGPKNVQSMKLPALQDSVIVIDEPQAISLEWWALVGRLIRYLTTKYNATVILMTATQPRILDNLDDVPTPTSLCNLQEECTDLLAATPRITFNLHQSLREFLHGYSAPPLSLEAAATELAESATKHQNTLAIVNTVESAVELTDHLQSAETVALGEHLTSFQQSTSDSSFDAVAYLEALAEQVDTVSRLTAVLTTRLRPLDRRALLEALEALLDPDTDTPFDNIPIVTISTQLIEAGVDLSFDRLYRDLAPLPAIVQAAGRCNRSFGETTSTVTMWRLDSPAGRDYIPSELIYGERSLLRPTRAVLQSLWKDVGVPQLPEAAVVSDGVEQYYALLHDQLRTGETADRLVNAFNTALGKVLREATFINQEYPTQDFLVLVTDDEHQTYRQYCEERENENWTAAKQLFQQLKPTLVSVPVREADESPELTVVDRELICEYEITTGRGVTLDPVVTNTEV
ncbi:CRISPR-associated endonuclease Cas3'' (plasmid) [Haloferax larsenii]|uniref:CRISPR-associated endonuclease Cas3 n=1 Tax=Haloferax larsenii TaxID=302484 RepID=A0ABY5RL49_HALLR|nr:CRISPR-associated endonuclease Cas3'' [Haloferax larsenii]UVE52262.1 CRISPR-associated endonuclease Cas3'' [Haloferax larsenii]